MDNGSWLMEEGKRKQERGAGGRMMDERGKRREDGRSKVDSLAGGRPSNGRRKKGDPSMQIGGLVS